MIHRSFVVALALGCLAVAFIGACGGSSEPPGPGPTVTVTSTEQPPEAVDPGDVLSHDERHVVEFVGTNLPAMERHDQWINRMIGAANPWSDYWLDRILVASREQRAIAKRWRRIDWAGGEVSRLEDCFDTALKAEGNVLYNIQAAYLGYGAGAGRAEIVVKNQLRWEREMDKARRALDEFESSQL